MTYWQFHHNTGMKRHVLAPWSMKHRRHCQDVRKRAQFQTVFKVEQTLRGDSKQRILSADFSISLAIIRACALATFPLASTSHGFPKRALRRSSKRRDEMSFVSIEKALSCQGLCFSRFWKLRGGRAEYAEQLSDRCTGMVRHAAFMQSESLSPFQNSLHLHIPQTWKIYTYNIQMYSLFSWEKTHNGKISWVAWNCRFCAHMFL